jgi:hypothetical protein
LVLWATGHRRSSPPEETLKDVKTVIGEMKALRRGNTLGKGVTIRDLTEEGRRF